VIYNPVELPECTPFDTREKFALLFLGRVGSRKGVIDLIEAVAKLAAQFPEIRLRVAGDGDIRGAARHAATLGISGNIEFLGWVRGEAKLQLLRQATIYVLPSYAEGLPMSVIEALAFGLPVVSTPVGGIPEAVSEGVEGFLVAPGSVDMLAARLAQLLSNPELRKQMGDRARRKAENAFAVECIVPTFDAVYAKLGITPAIGNRDQA
jgi:glycosyltransferase involved in cell wall biosynthesis